jgi:hypothetical protein
VESSKREKKGGRIKGTPNKITQELRQRILSIMENELTMIEKSELSTKERIDLIGKLLPFLIPKMNEHSIITPEIFKPIIIHLNEN